jgi:hypothetical protein
MKKVTLFAALLTAGLLLNGDVSAQGFLKKLKEKVQDAASDVAGKKTAEAVGVDPNASSQNSGNSSSTSHSGRPANKTGEGLKNTTPPDVNQQLTDAETAHTAGNYSDARYSIQQALLGIELQMGRNILKSLPATIAGLPQDTLEDRVTSTQWGWNNLTIQRIYRKDDKQFTVTVGNNSIYGPLMDVYFAGNYGAQSNGQTQDFKQIKVKGNKAVIKFDQNEGYTALVHLGQAGMLTFQGINFANEQDMMAAINTIDVDGIKKMLGEK